MRSLYLVIKLFFIFYCVLIFIFTFIHFYFFVVPTNISNKILTNLIMRYENYFLSREDIREDRTIDRLWGGVNLYPIYKLFYKFVAYLKVKPLWWFVYLYRLHVPLILHFFRFFWFLGFFFVNYVSKLNSTLKLQPVLKWGREKVSRQDGNINKLFMGEPKENKNLGFKGKIKFLVLKLKKKLKYIVLYI